jgi:Na+:H+ antiporter, NhaA family
VAIADDIGAVLVIALFYTDELAWMPLTLAAPVLALVLVLNRNGVTHAAPYLVLGIALWAGVLKSGIHATLAGVAGVHDSGDGTAQA